MVEDILVLKNVTKSIGERNILTDVSFTLKKGETLGYLGPNGAGKTTTIRIILDLLKPTSGNAFLFDKKASEADRRRVGVVLENAGFYDNLSAEVNLSYYSRIYNIRDKEGRVKELLEFMNLWDRRNDKVGTFSKGMRQKLAIAKSLLHDPELLIFDEITSGLDPEARIIVREAIMKLENLEKTILLSSHDLEEIQKIATQIIILKKGRIIVNDSLGNLRSRHNVPLFEVSVDKLAVTEKILSRLGFVSDFKAATANRLLITLKSYENAPDLLEVLIKEGVKVFSSSIIQSSLEEVYLDIIREDKKKVEAAVDVTK
ncbi:MAG: ABC transporter ATP-binding protein [Candidatus Bathyarchaeota archaeon]|nr:ABC transporter ATP-binding protein [Candidatus Bathyarchaeota archaeon]